MSLIQLIDVNLTIDNIPILKDISLNIDRRRITTIIGPNGAGKTTLLKLMLGLSVPTSGKIYRNVTSIGYMPQKIQINPLLPLTVRRFIQLASPKKITVINNRVEQVLHEVGICHLQERMMSVLSGGELQRVLLARALMLEPDILILDEPAQGVDVIGQAELYALISKIRDQRGCGIVLVSHDLHLVMAASDEVVCLNQHICCSGHPHIIQKDPDYLALFPAQLYPLNLAVYEHKHDHRHSDSVENESNKCGH